MGMGFFSFKDKNMDIVYFVRGGEENDELKYSLRSLANLPHGTVHIVGYKPSWVTNVNHIEVIQDKGGKNLNTTHNMLVAAQSDDISENFILMNDDFFIMKPLSELPHYNRGSIEKVAEYYRQLDSMYYRGMLDTREYMEKLGIKSSLSYELHIPMIFNKKNVIKMFEQYYKDQPPVAILHKRTLYGNMFNYGGKEIKDVKVYTNDGQTDRESTFLSTQDDAWEYSKIGRFIRRQFKEKCQYEK